MDTARFPWLELCALVGVPLPPPSPLFPWRNAKPTPPPWWVPRKLEAPWWIMEHNAREGKVAGVRIETQPPVHRVLALPALTCHPMPKHVVDQSDESGEDSDGGKGVGANAAFRRSGAGLKKLPTVHEAGNGKQPIKSAPNDGHAAMLSAKSRGRQAERAPARTGSRPEALNRFSTGHALHVGVPHDDEEDLSQPSHELVKALLRQMAFQSDEIAKLSAAVKNQQDMLQHFATQMAHTSGNTRFTDMPPVYDPRDGLPVPGAFEPHQRDMHPREESDLARKIFQLEKVDRSKRDGMRRIVDPENEYARRQCPVVLTAMDTCMKWKLWHYVMHPETTLRGVLTPAELSASHIARGQSHVEDASRALPLTQATAHREALEAQSKSSDAQALKNASSHVGLSPGKRHGDGTLGPGAPSTTVARLTEGRASPRSNMSTPLEDALEAGSFGAGNDKNPVAMPSREQAIIDAARNSGTVRPQPSRHVAHSSVGSSRASSMGSPGLFGEN